MTIWEILEIEPTSDISSIRKAYAEKLPQYHPEDDPEGFQQLRQAYENAKKLAKKGISAELANDANYTADNVWDSDQDRQTGDVTNESPQDRQTGDVTNEIPQEYSLNLEDIAHKNRVIPDMQGNLQIKITELLNQMTALYFNDAARIDIESWRPILQADLLRKQESIRVVRYIFLQFFIDRPLIPQSIWRLFDSTFLWSERLDYPTSRENSWIDILLREINEKWNFDYTNLKAFFGTAPLDQYAMIRRNLRDAIINDQESNAYALFYDAISIYSDDPDTYRIYYDYIRSLGPNRPTAFGKKADLFILDKLLSRTPNDDKFLEEKAGILSHYGEYNNANEIYQQLVSRKPNMLRLKLHLAEVYDKQQGRKVDAEKIRKDIIRAYPKIQSNLEHERELTIDAAPINAILLENQHIFDILKYSREQEMNYPAHSEIPKVFLASALFAMGAALFLIPVIIHYLCFKEIQRVKVFAICGFLINILAAFFLFITVNRKRKDRFYLSSVFLFLAEVILFIFALKDYVNNSWFVSVVDIFLFLLIPHAVINYQMKNKFTTKIAHVLGISIIYWSIASCVCVYLFLDTGKMYSLLFSLAQLLFHCAVLLPFFPHINLTVKKIRNTFVSVMWCFLTMGLYRFYWMCLVDKEINLHNGKDKVCTKEIACIAFIPFYSVYFVYSKMEEISEIARQKSILMRDYTALVLLFECIGMHFFSLAVIQNRLNLVNRQCLSE